MSENPEKEEILVSQLATEPYLLSRGRLDNRKLTKIRSSKETPDTYAAYLYFGITDTIIEAHKNRVPIGINQALLNNSLNYNIALLTDASGIMSFVAMPLVVWSIITSFIFLPLSFLGSDMVILTYVWALIGLGLLISVMLALAGGRRMS